SSTLRCRRQHALSRRCRRRPKPIRRSWLRELPPPRPPSRHPPTRPPRPSRTPRTSRPTSPRAEPPDSHRDPLGVSLQKGRHIMAKLSTDELLDAFKEMTLIELSEFVKQFEDTFEVTAAAPVAVAAA